MAYGMDIPVEPMDDWDAFEAEVEKCAPHYVPSPDDIVEATRLIQDGWTDKQERSRVHPEEHPGRRVPTIVRKMQKRPEIRFRKGVGQVYRDHFPNRKRRPVQCQGRLHYEILKTLGW